MVFCGGQRERPVLFLGGYIESCVLLPTSCLVHLVFAFVSWHSSFDRLLHGFFDISFDSQEI